MIPKERQRRRNLTAGHTEKIDDDDQGPNDPGFLGKLSTPFAASPSLWAVAGAAVGNVVTTLLDWQERASQRRQLLDLDDAALKDFGRSRADAAREGTKPFWRT